MRLIKVILLWAFCLPFFSINTYGASCLTKYQIDAQSNRNKKVIYLTFDDGPSLYTNKIVDTLKAYNISATFFVIGTNIKKGDQRLKYAYNNCNSIQMHSMTHRKEIIYAGTGTNLMNELSKEQTLIKSITGVKPDLFRPPYGSSAGLTKSMQNKLINARIRVWDWNTDPQDWRGLSTTQIMANIKRQPRKSQEVIVLHERANTLAALPSIIKYYKSLGYTFKAYSTKNRFHLNQKNNPYL